MTLPVHVQMDVGMSRGGCLPEEATALVRFVVAAPRLRLAGAMTHFSSPASDETFTKEQAKLFRHWIDGVKPLLAESAKKGHGPCVVHAANTAATLRSRRPCTASLAYTMPTSTTTPARQIKIPRSATCGAWP